MKTFMFRHGPVPAFVCTLAMSLLASNARAATLTWTGQGGDNNTGTAANWSPAQVPAANDILIFDGILRLAPANNLNAATAFNGITFPSSANPFTLSGNSITLAGDISDQSRNTQTISAALVLGAIRNCDVAAAGQFTISSVISGTGGLTKTGLGAMSLTGTANTYTGSSTITGGILAIAADLSLGAAPAAATPGALVINGGTFRDGTTFTLSPTRGIALGPPTGSGFGQIDMNANTLTYGGIIANNAAGTGALIKTGQGTLLLFGASTYTGGTTITQGILTESFTTAGAAASQILPNGTALTLGGSPQSTTVGTAAFVIPTLSIVGSAAAANTQTFGGVALPLGSAAINVTGGAAATPVTVNLGAITRPGASALNLTLPAAGSGSVTTSNTNVNGILGGWSTIGNNWAAVNAGAIGSYGTAPFGLYTDLTAATVTINSDPTSNVRLGAATTAASLTAAGTTEINTLQLLNTAAVTLTVGSGNILRLGANGAIWRTDVTTVTGLTIGTANVGTLTAGGAPNTPGEIVLYANSSGTTGDGIAMTINSNIADNGTGAVKLIKAGNNRVVMPVANTYSGGTFVNSGELNLTNVSALGTGAVTIMPASQIIPNAAGTFANNVVVSGIGTSSSASFGAIRFNVNGITWGGAGKTITLAGDSRVGTNTASATFTLASQITGGFNLEFASAAASPGSTFILSNTANDFGGNLAINGLAGSISNSGLTLKLGASEVIPNGAGKGNLIITGGTTTTTPQVFDLNGFNETINGLVSAGTAAQAAVINNGATAATLTVGDNNQTATFAGVVKAGTGVLNIAKIGTGTQVFSGANTYTGTTTVSAGRLSISADSGLGAAPASATPGSIVLNAGALGASATFTLNSNRGIALGPTTGTGSGTINVDPGFTVTYPGTIANNGGTGSLIKAGGGKLNLDGPATYTGTTTINGGTLQAGTTLSAPVTVNAGGALGPGTSTTPGTLTLSDPTTALTMTGAAQLNFRLNAAPSLTPVAGNDFISIPNGGATLSGTVSVSGSLPIGAASGTYRLISAPNGTITGTLTASLPPGLSGLVTVSAHTVDITINVLNGSKFWSGLGADTKWTTGANWVGGLAPTANNNIDLTFPAGVAQQTANNDFPAGSTFKTITVTGAGYTIQGAALSLTGSGTVLTITATGGSMTINAPLTASGGIQLNDGTLVFGADSTFTGGIVLGDSPGTTTALTNMDMTNANVTVGGFVAQQNNVTANTITIGIGKTFTVTGNMTIGFQSAATNGPPTNTTFTGGGNLAVISTGATIQIGGSVTNNTDNTATLDLSGLGQFTANLGSSGLVRIGDANPGGNTPTNGASTMKLPPASVITAGTLEVGTKAGQNVTFTLTLGTASTTLNCDTISIGSDTSSSAGRCSGVINFASTTGTLTINGSNGTSGCALNVLNSSAATTSSVSAAMDLTGHTSTLNLSSLAVGQSANGNGSTTAGARTGTFGFNQGTLTTASLVAGNKGGNTSNFSPVTGTVNISGGTVIIGSIQMGSYTASSTASNLTGTGGALGTINITAGTVNITNGVALGQYNTAQAGFSGDGNGTINISGTPTVTIAGNVTLASYQSTGVGHGVGAINITGATVTINGTVSKVTSSVSALATFSLNGGSVDMVGHALGSAIPIDTLTLQAGTLKNASQVNGGAGFAKTGVGVLLVDGTNGYSGIFTISAGTVRAVSINSFSPNSVYALANTAGAVLDLNSLNQVAGLIAGGGISGGAVTLGAGTLTVDSDNVSASFGGQMSGTGGLTKTGSGVLTITSAQAYTGATMVSGGILRLNGSTGTIDTSSGLTINGGGIFDIDNTIGTEPTSRIGNAVTVTMAGGTLSMSAGGNNRTETVGTLAFAAGTSNTIVLNANGSSNAQFTSGGTLPALGTASLNMVRMNAVAGGTGTGNLFYSGQTTDVAAPIAGVSVNGQTAKYDATSGTPQGLVQSTGAVRYSVNTNSGGSWGDPTNWDGLTTVPAASDLVVVRHALVLDQDRSAAQIVFDAFSASIDGNFSLNCGNFLVTGFHATISSVIGGNASGAVFKDGAGTLILAANNAYTGSTTIDAGVLVIGADSATGTLGAGNVLNNGILAFERSDVVNVNSAISGTGSVQQSGSGTLTLFGTNSYTGKTVVSNGTLNFASITDAGTPGPLGSGASIDLGAATLQYSGNGDSSNRAINLVGAGTINAVGNATLALSGGIAGTGFPLVLTGTSDAAENGAVTGATTLTKLGNDTWTLGGVNTISGAVTIESGTLALNANQIVNGSVTFGLVAGSTNSSTLSIGGNVTFNGALTVQTNAANGNTISVVPGKTLTIGGNVLVGPPSVAATTKLIATGGGTMAINNSAANGLLLVGVNAAGNTVNTSTFDASGLDTLIVSLNTGSGVVRVNSVQATNNNSVSTLLLPTTGTGTSTITASALNVGDNSSSNGTVINTVLLGSGVNTLNIGTINIATGSRDSGSITFASGAGSVVIRNAAGSGRAAFNMSTGNQNTGVATLNPVFDVSGHSADLLLGAVSIGTQSRGNAITTTFSFDANKMDMTSLTLGTRAADETNGAGLARTTNATLNIGGGTVTIGSGILNLGSAAGTYTSNATDPNPIINAAINISGGTVNIGATGGTSITMATDSATGGTGAAAQCNGVLNITGGTVTVAGNILRGGGTSPTSATITLNGGTLDMSGFSIGSATLSVDTINFQSGTLKNELQVNNGGGFAKSTAGTLTLAGVNSYTGTFTVNGGTLTVANTNALSAGASYNLANAAGVVLDLNSLNQAAGSIAGGGATGGNILLETATLTIGGDNTNTNFGGVISGSGALIKIGAGTQALSGVNLYDGLTTVNGGVLQAASNSALGSSVAGTVVASGGTLEVVSGADISSETLSVSGTGSTGTNGALHAASGTLATSSPITLNANTLIRAEAGAAFNLSGAISLGANLLAVSADASVSGAPSAISGVLSGTGGSLDKTGTGALILNAPTPNLYTGTTAVDGGELIVSATHTTGGAYTISGAGVLRGTVPIASPVSAPTSGGFVAPGDDNTPANLLLNASGTALSLNASGGLNFRLNTAPTLTPQAGNDFITVPNGTVSVAGVVNISGGLNIGAASGTYRVLSAPNGVSGSMTLGSTPPGITGSVTVNPTSIDVNVTVGDSPKTWSGQSAVNSNWTTGANWSGGIAPNPALTPDLVFPANAAQLTNTNDFPAATTLNSITITGNGYSLGGAGVNLSSTGTSLSVTTTLGNTAIMPVTAAGAMLVSTPGGSLALNGNNIIAGTLTLGASAGTTNTASLDLSNANLTVGGALTAQYNSATGGTITIGTGNTFTVNNSVTVGFPATAFDQPTVLTISGGGSFVINSPAGTLQLGGSAVSSGTISNKPTLDMSGLATFTATVGTVRIGDANDGAGIGQASGLGTLLLAGTSTITATNLNVGDNGYAVVHALKLGSVSNVLNVTNFNLGTGNRAGGSVTFNSPTGTLTVRDATGAGRAALNIATGGTATGVGTPTDVFDTTGHSADLLLSMLAISDQARHANRTSNFKFDTGTLDANGFLLGKRSTTTAGTNTVTTNVTISGGTVTVGTGGITLLNQSSTITTATDLSSLILTGGTLTVNNDITVQVTPTISSTATLTLNGGTLDMKGHAIGGATPVDVLNFQSGTLKNVAEINNGAAWTKTTAAGVLVLDGVSTFTGGVTVSAGILQIAASTAFGAATGAVSVTSGAQVELLNNVTVPGKTVTINGNGIGAALGTSLPNRGAVQAGLSSTAGWTGPVIIGTNQARLGAQANGVFTVSGVVDDGVNTFELDISADPNGGVVILSGANTYGGFTGMVRGTLKLGANNTLPATTLDVRRFGGVVTDFTAVDLNGFSQNVSALQNTANDGPGGSTGTALTNSSATSGTLTVTQAANGAYSGVITGNVALVKAGSAMLTLSGPSTYAGTTTISDGILQAGAAGSFSPNSAVTIANLATAIMDLNNFNQTIGSLAGGGALGGNVTPGSATLSAGSNNASTTYSGVISGGGNVGKQGGGTFTLTAAQTFGGTLNLAAGAVTVSATGSLVSGGVASVNNGAILNYNGSGTTPTVIINGSLAPSDASQGSQLRGVGTVGGVLASDAANSNAVVWAGAAKLPQSLNANEVLTCSSLSLNSGGKLAAVINNTGGFTQRVVTTGAVAPTVGLDSTSTLSFSVDKTATLSQYVLLDTGILGIPSSFAFVNAIAGATFLTAGTDYDLIYRDTVTPSADIVNPPLGSSLPGNVMVNQVVVRFKNTNVTPVTIADFDATPQGAGALLEWTAVSEFKNAGFNVYRRPIYEPRPQGSGNNWTRANSTFIAGRISNPDAKSYRFYDWPTPGVYEYKLESVSISQNIEIFGPALRITIGELDADVTPPGRDAAAAGVWVDAENARGEMLSVALDKLAGGTPAVQDGDAAASVLSRSESPQTSRDRKGAGMQGASNELPRFVAVRSLGVGQPLTDARGSGTTLDGLGSPSYLAGVRFFSSAPVGRSPSFTGAKIVYDKSGVLLVPQASLPEGFNPAHVAVQREGRAVSALAVTADGLLLYGPGYSDDYTDKDVFFLRNTAAPTAAGQTLRAQGLFASAQPVNVETSATVTAAYHDVYFDFQNLRPYDYPPWFSAQYLTGGSTQRFTLDTPHVSSGTASLTVTLWSLTQSVPPEGGTTNPASGTTNDHALQVFVNGQLAGQTQWSGGGNMMQVTFPAPAGVLLNGTNQIDLVTPQLNGVDSQIALLHSLSMSYTRDLDASAPVEIVNASAFSKLYELNDLPSANAWVVDARYPDRAALVPYETQAQADGTYKLRFTAQSGGAGEYLVVPAGMENQPISVSKRQVKPAKASVYLATGPNQFSAGVQALLAKRAKEGLRGAFADQEQLFDYYNYGRYGPAGIQNAVRSIRPQYLLLLGRTTYDYHNYSGLNVDPLCPTFLVSTSFWSQATSDSLFGDLGRGTPEVAVGRLPVNTPNELSVAVHRILSHDEPRPQGSGLRVHAVADALDPTVADFAAEADSIAQANPEFAWQQNYLGVTYATSPEVTAAMRDAANGGADLLLYVGHGNAVRLGMNDPRILQSDGVIDNVKDWTGNAVFVQATCTANWMAKDESGYRSIAIQALTQPQGGISASIGTSTYMNPDVGAAFANQLLQNAGSSARWGSALLNAQRWAGAQTGSAYYGDMMRTEQLFGDPAMPIHAPQAGLKAQSGVQAGSF